MREKEVCIANSISAQCFLLQAAFLLETSNANLDYLIIDSWMSTFSGRGLASILIHFVIWNDILSDDFFSVRTRFFAVVFKRTIVDEGGLA